jgi:threonine dehydrogenase-like Zn-dependent dehydrogenase
VLGIAGRDGAFAELLALPAANCHVVPEGVSDRAAVFVEPLAAAAHVLDAVELERGMHAAVLGSGRLGLLVAQVLLHEPAELRVVGRNPRTLALCARWGIATAAPHAVPDGSQDVVVECSGAADGLRAALRMCRPCGTIVLKSTYAASEPVDLAPVVVNEVRVVGSRCGDFAAALRLLEERRVAVEELITAVYPLSRGVEALAAAGQPEHIKILLEPAAA